MQNQIVKRVLGLSRVYINPRTESGQCVARVLMSCARISSMRLTPLLTVNTACHVIKFSTRQYMI